MIYKNLLLDDFQEQSIELIKKNQSVVVTAPTGVGKTIIADFIVDQAIAHDKRVIYTAPIKALSNQKYREFCRSHGEACIGLVTGDLVLNRNAQILIMTTEILRNMLIQEEPEIKEFSYVIFDEIHFLGDLERGTVWEEVLIYLPREIKILGLSATITNIEHFAEWLSFVRSEKIHVIVERERKVPLEFHIANREEGLLSTAEFEQVWRRKHHKLRKSKPWKDSTFNRAADEYRTSHSEVIEIIGSAYLPCLYFVFSRRLAETYARELEEIHEKTLLSPSEQAEMEEIIGGLEAKDRKVFFKLLQMYRKGIAFHHAGLNVLMKWLVERLYEKKLIKVLYCTSTFALGMNMPAKTVIFDDIKKYNGREVAPLTVLQFMQKAGRAGRRGIDPKGFVVIKQELEEYDKNRQQIQTYLNAQYENIESTFNLSYNSVVNLLSKYDIPHIKNIIKKSFKNFGKNSRLLALEERIKTLEATVARECGGHVCTLSKPQVEQRQRIKDKVGKRQHRELEHIQKRFINKIYNRKSLLREFPGYHDLLQHKQDMEAIIDMIQKMCWARYDQLAFKEARALMRLLTSLEEDLEQYQLFSHSLANADRESEPDHCDVCVNQKACRLSAKGETRLQLKKLTKLLQKEDRRTYKDFYDKLFVLQKIGYIDENQTLLSGGRILSHIQIEEILTSELIFSGMFEDLAEDQIFAVCASLSVDLPRCELVEDSNLQPFRALAGKIQVLRLSYRIMLAERFSSSRFIFCEEMLYLGHLWAKGQDIITISRQIKSETDISGDLISGFRRARDLMKQLKEVYGPDEYMIRKLNNAINMISRDEVEVV
jgi:superfamily II RNA helicase